MRIFDGSIRVAILAALFGTGSWIAITGLWLELPLLIPRLPEGWRLASHLNLVIQSANVGPLLYWAFHKANLIGDVVATHLQLLIGIVSAVFLIFFWQTTAFIFGSSRSIVLFLSTFGMALVDCTSSITFLTFMARFDSKYMAPYLVGEGLSGFIPSLVAMLQGVQVVEDTNNDSQSANSSSISSLSIEPRFSVETFFVSLLCTLCMSYVAFLALQWTPFARREQKKLTIQIQMNSVVRSTIVGTSQPTKVDIKPTFQTESHQPDVNSSYLRKAYFFLLGLMVLNCFTTFGLMPSIQPFSALVYGPETMHSVVILAGLSYPFGCFFAMFCKTKSVLTMTSLTILGGFFGVPIICVAVNGVNGVPFMASSWAPTIMVGCWVAFVSITSFAKTLITVWICDYNRTRGMFWVGMATQFGSCLGAGFAFVLVNYTTIFTKNERQ